MDYQGIEIVGFNGEVSVACGRAVAVARSKDRSGYFRLPSVAKAPDQINRYPEEEIKALNRDGWLTLFLLEPRPAFEGIKITFVTSRFLKSLDYELPQELNRDFDWLKLEPQGSIKLQEDVWAACLHSEVLEKEMNQWGNALLDRAMNRLDYFFATQDKRGCEDALLLAELANCAASDPAIRARVYVCRGVALEQSAMPDKLIRLHRLIIKPQFPTWNWDNFRTEVRQWAEVRGDKVAAKAAARPFPIPELQPLRPDPETMHKAVQEESALQPPTQDPSEELPLEDRLRHLLDGLGERARTADDQEVEGVGTELDAGPNHGIEAKAYQDRDRKKLDQARGWTLRCENSTERLRNSIVAAKQVKAKFRPGKEAIDAFKKEIRGKSRVGLSFETLTILASSAVFFFSNKLFERYRENGRPYLDTKAFSDAAHEVLDLGPKDVPEDDLARKVLDNSFGASST